jgi:DNA repair exonuclease SbcCD ATPase subunit
VKIKNMSVQGFRGFNEVCTVDFHDQITLISAPNSYGKTSISEAFEWLLYGITSKVEKADSKDEYKGSCRNTHLPTSLTPFVKVVFEERESEVEFRGELLEGDAIKRFVNGYEVNKWPFSDNLPSIPKPFILQHALKYLLLVKPDERFLGFARLLGLEDLDQIQRNVVSLCTKPDAAVPPEVKQLVKNIEALEARVATQSSLAAIEKALKKAEDLTEIYKTIVDECRRRVPPNTEAESILPQLLKIREDAVSKIFKGRVILKDYTPTEKQINSEDEKLFLGFATDSFVKNYTNLTALATIHHIIKRAQFFNLGVEFLRKTPEKCPFCGRPINEMMMQHINNEHEHLFKEKDHIAALEKQREEVLKSLKELRNHLETNQTRHIGKAGSILTLEYTLSQLKSILLPKHQTHFNVVQTTISQLLSSKQKLNVSFTNVIAALDKVETSIHESKEDIVSMKLLGETIVEYINYAHSFAQLISSNASEVSEADQILRHELDTLAGTEDISVLVDLLERWKDIEKKFEIKYILDNLKDLKKAVEQYVSKKMLDAISSELTSEVMEWYERIKTTGDPDVHFCGFDIERTTKGELKARRVQIKATSYGKDLVSAVSSLSESKLNALGLCVSIATNLKGNSPFEFLIIDDPIQSWDAEHEAKFIEVIRRLVDHGKQVVLLSHNEQWIKQVRSGCRTLNGWFYEITGFTEAGPHISEVPWAEWNQRLQEVDAILKNSSASTTTLQRAEAEIRITIEDIISELWWKKKGVWRSRHRLGCKEVRRMLLECGVQEPLLDHITQTYETTDPAHHAETKYTPNRDRIRCYHSWVHELAKLLG